LKFKDSFTNNFYSQVNLESFDRVFYERNKNKEFVEAKLYRYINGEQVFFKVYEKYQYISGIQEDEAIEKDKGSIPYTPFNHKIGVCSPRFYSTSALGKAQSAVFATQGGKKRRYKKTELSPLGSPHQLSSDPKPKLPNIITMDYETRKLDSGILEVISCAIYDGNQYQTFYLSDFISPQ
jgi:hypothetical protein